MVKLTLDLKQQNTLSHLPLYEDGVGLLLDENNMCPKVSNVVEGLPLKAFVYAQSDSESFMVVFNENYVDFEKNPISSINNATFYKLIDDNITKIKAHIQIDNKLITKLVTLDDVTLDDVIFIEDGKINTRHNKFSITSDVDHGGGNCDVCGLIWDSFLEAQKGMFPIRTAEDGSFWCSNACVPFFKSYSKGSTFTFTESDYKEIPLNQVHLKKWELYLKGTYLELKYLDFNKLEEIQKNIGTINDKIKDIDLIRQKNIRDLTNKIENLPYPAIQRESDINILEEIQKNIGTINDKIKDIDFIGPDIQNQFSQLKDKVNAEVGSLIKKHLSILFSENDNITDICKAVISTLEKQINASVQYREIMKRDNIIYVFVNIARTNNGIFLKINNSILDFKQFIQDGKFQMPPEIKTTTVFSKTELANIPTLDSVITEYDNWRTQHDELNKQLMSINEEWKSKRDGLVKQIKSIQAAPSASTETENTGTVNSLPGYKLRF